MSDEYMDDEDFQGVLAGLRDVAAYERGERKGFVTHVPKGENVCADIADNDRPRAGNGGEGDAGNLS